MSEGAENLHSAEFSPVDLDDGNGKVNHEWTRINTNFFQGGYFPLMADFRFDEMSARG